jgi:hypothetical protein
LAKAAQAPSQRQEEPMLPACNKNKWPKNVGRVS